MIDLDAIKVNEVAQKFIDKLEAELRDTFIKLDISLIDNTYAVIPYPYEPHKFRAWVEIFDNILDVAKYIVVRRNTLDPLYSFVIATKGGKFVNVHKY